MRRELGLLRLPQRPGIGYARTPPWLLQPGDVVEVEVERLGVLRNEITDNDARLRPA